MALKGPLDFWAAGAFWTHLFFFSSFFVFVEEPSFGSVGICSQDLLFAAAAESADCGSWTSCAMGPGAVCAGFKYGDVGAAKPGGCDAVASCLWLNGHQLVADSAAKTARPVPRTRTHTRTRAANRIATTPP